MKKLVVLFAVAVAVGVAVSAALSAGDTRNVLKFDTMAPVDAPYTGATNAIRGVPGGGVPWVIDSAHGQLRANGRLHVEVEGLVLASTGANPVGTFKAIVSCLSSSAGAPTTVNVATTPVPATTAGNAEIDATISLPSPCFAPIVFVTSGGGSWFAVTGR
jgi:hypothetical protein